MNAIRKTLVQCLMLGATLALVTTTGCVVDRPVMSMTTTTTLTNKLGGVSTVTEERHLRRTTGALWPASQDATALKSGVTAKGALSAGTGQIGQEGTGGTNGLRALELIESTVRHANP